MADIREILDLIDAFIDNESSLAAYYGLCMERFPETREKWECLKREEELHAEVFRNIRKSAEENPRKWRLGRYQIQTVRLICSSVKGQTEELRQGKMNPRYAIHFITDVEQSLIESNISKSLETDVPEFQQLLTRVQEDTVAHKNLLLSIGR